MPDTQFNALVWLLRHVRGIYGNLPIQGHNAFASTACPGRFFPMAEVRRLEYRGVEASPPGEEITPSLYEVTTQTTPLNVRSAPGMEGTIRGTLPNGTRVTAMRRSGGWLYVVFGELSGWSSASFLDEVVDTFPFTDVRSGDWFYDAVRDMWERGIVTGTTASTFSPNDTLTRAAAVTLLYRIAGLPDVAIGPEFIDVPGDQWFSDAVTWAHDRGVVQGVGDGQFAPHDPVTREQFAVMFYRYAEAMGCEVTIPAGFALDFPDARYVSDWALDGMRWAVHRGLIRGNDQGVLMPQGTATRAECAAILQRFVRFHTSP